MKSRSLALTVVFLIITLVIVSYIAFITAHPFDESQKLAFHFVFKSYLIAASLCFLISEVTKNYSQVDKLWSLIPIFYAWAMVYYSDFYPRAVLMAILVTIWGIRLSFNFARRGGYQLKFWEGEEDYRWEILRNESLLSKPLVWSIFNLFFISFYQMGLILYFTLPIILSWGSDSQALMWIDWLLAGIAIVFIIIETIADQQQYDFQTKKYQLISEGKDLHNPFNKGFIDSGLWSKVRHPNYMAEQGFWIVIYLFSVVATGQFINWTIGGIILLLLLFRGSSDFSENISSSKYPAFKEYMESVPRFIPKIF